MPKRTEHNLIVRIGKSEATVTNNKRLHLRNHAVIKKALAHSIAAEADNA